MNTDENSINHVHLTNDTLMGSYAWKGKLDLINIVMIVRKDVSVMCNLSQGIKEDGIAIGRAMGEAAAEAKIITNMYNNGLTADQIATVINKDLEEVKAIIQGKEPVTA